MFVIVGGIFSLGYKRFTGAIENVSARSIAPALKEVSKRQEEALGRVSLSQTTALGDLASRMETSFGKMTGIVEQVQAQGNKNAEDIAYLKGVKQGHEDRG